VRSRQPSPARAGRGTWSHNDQEPRQYLAGAGAESRRIAAESLAPSVRPELGRRPDAGREGPLGGGLSGGADSLALLLLLWAHWPERRARLVALHFNHRLRGAAADADERFCRRVCRSLGIRLQVGRWKNRRLEASEAEARAADSRSSIRRCTGSERAHSGSDTNRTTSPRPC